jgi:hypothetical protein
MLITLSKNVGDWIFSVEDSGHSVSISGPLGLAVVYENLSVSQKALISQGKPLEIEGSQREQFLRIEEIGGGLRKSPSGEG